MARCPDVHLKPLSRLEHCVGNLVMVRLTQSVKNKETSNLNVCVCNV
jgi:hypothetical protein